eukprot:TRINITY_DN2135_c0_g1_i8.p1 TRINITY_DN2135_c0_g1~~TRINITY_DN2135_c0_g1_i8.p1  ORF type:complete len:133 (-),score=30.49 TRINITY_DN2135_c0_g1_i8:11-370(-)
MGAGQGGDEASEQPLGDGGLLHAHQGAKGQQSWSTLPQANRHSQLLLWGASAPKRHLLVEGIRHHLVVPGTDGEVLPGAGFLVREVMGSPPRDSCCLTPHVLCVDTTAYSALIPLLTLR